MRCVLDWGHQNGMVRPCSCPTTAEFVAEDSISIFGHPLRLFCERSATRPERHIFRVPATESSVRPRPGVADSVASRFRVIAPRELQGLMVGVYVIYLTLST